MLLIPLALRLICRQAAAPHRLVKFGQAQLWAADGEALQAITGGIVVGFPDARTRPVGAAEDADVASPHLLVQALHQGADGNVRIVAVQQVDVDLIDVQPFQAFGKVRDDVLRGHAGAAVADRVAALIEQHDLVPIAALAEPFSEGRLALATRIDVGRIETVAARFDVTVQQGKGRTRVVRGADHGAENQL